MGIIGIGYEGLTLDAFVSRLRLRDVRVLIDVRLNAISRKRGFAKRALGSALEEAGITYIHRPVLGNERDNRDGYAGLETPQALTARDRYRTALATAEGTAAIRELADLASTQLIAVLCYEADERHCHREQVIEAVNAILDGVPVPS